MFIEQIIEFESRVTWPMVVHIFLKLVIFMTKQKSSLKMLQKAMYLDFPGLSQVTKFSSKMQDIKRVLDLTWRKRNDFFNWLSNIKKFVLPNSSENVRNVIRIALKQPFFLQKSTKNCPAAGGFAPMPPLWHVWVALICLPRLPILIG